MNRRPHTQPRIPGVRRVPVATALLPAVEQWIRGEMRRHNASRSFVLATCAAYVAESQGVRTDQPDYKTAEPQRRRKQRAA